MTTNTNIAENGSFISDGLLQRSKTEKHMWDSGINNM